MWCGLGLYQAWLSLHFRVDKEKAQVRSELDDIAGQLETMARGKVQTHSILLSNI